MYALSSLPPNPSTTARGWSSLTRARICSNQLKTSGRVSPVATRPSTPPTDSITGLEPAARTTAYPGVITSESPATQRRSFRSGVNATFLGGFGGFAGGGAVAGAGVDGGGRRPDSGSAISVSISSASDRR